MVLYLIRHADAESIGKKGIKTDKDRSLTEYGLQQSRIIGKALKKMNIYPDYFFTSPYLRAKQTAELIIDNLDKSIKLQEKIAISSGALPHEIISFLKTLDSKGIVILVGHLPDLGILVSYLVWGNDTLEIPISKGGIACLEIPDISNAKGISKLRSFLTFDQVERIAE